MAQVCQIRDDNGLEAVFADIKSKVRVRITLFVD